MAEDQDKLAAEWAAALAEEGAASKDAAEEDLADAWASALAEQEGKPDAGASSEAELADQWAKALADEEATKVQREKKQKQLAAQSQDFQYKDLTAEAKAQRTGSESLRRDLEFILDIPLEVSAQLGSTKLLINELLQLGQGSVIELNKLAGEPLEILVNGKLVARGEAVVINEKFGVRLTDIISPIERVKQLA
ncbi:MAG: flagellar motor switch protein FliN [Desulfomicrobiaceae bacterium]|jgi:flagellar motor switch protein FliN/FliY|nr:flagellar motor switch protein FliN [Desulfomicrobiaceae bacterium]MDI3493313.1 flagellar motor switch protein FliN [Desulfomicrobiaceae bacterium]MDK2873686.1 flagellar motor switch protein FliN [Desulfomicrobiaceae bacterium]HCF05574.1 flagellar motor switch protein FliN [Desulfomicrobiaceae bacterium]